MKPVISFKSNTVRCREILAAVIFAAAWQGNARAQLMADYVSPSLLKTNRPAVASTNPALSRTESDLRTVAVRPTALTSGERWEKFEAEFGITNKNSSAMMGSVESAKYQLDKSTFAMQEFVNSVVDTLSFDYGVSDLTGSKPSSTTAPPQPNANPVLDSLENARLKSDINLTLAGPPFVGVRLVMPFGN
jgi:hypothetical protein